MDRLPDELVIRIFNFLDVADIVNIQLVSSRYLALGRDDTVWKEECFSHSRSEARRRRQHLLEIQDARLAELRFAVTALPGVESMQAARVTESVQRSRALVNWDPGYPTEKLDFYQEYMSRHAPVQIGWLNLPNGGAREATGVGILHSSTARHAVAPLDDGSICIWDVSARTTSSPGGGGGLLGQSAPGLLSALPGKESRAIMTETGAVECVSIDSSSRKGYFAVLDQLHEINLDTLQLLSSKKYPWPITALSSSDPQNPLAIGTNNTIHLYDPRDPIFASSNTSTGELIGGSPYSHAILPQPGPLSILNTLDGDSLYVAGRFTSILHFSRRFFPRLLGTTFSGARIAALALFPHPFIPRELDLVRNPALTISEYTTAKSLPGSTLLAAAEYKGKGSLELYSLSTGNKFYHNRQTASASKLLSIANHGGKIVISDGDGNLRWFERDGSSHIRTFNIQDSTPKPSASAPTGGGIWHNDNNIPGQGDIVQKILPLPHSSSPSVDERPDIGTDNLLLWTGDGRLGILGFGHRDPLGENRGIVEGEVKSTAQKAKEDAERSYEGAMRRALERNADEVRFVRGLGMGY
ncbi:uncharacterized protein RCC_02026 [Ramularia collo-cygni]|uniref:F-box domain-containing protein n=1 Tax=Ramularia collo-cygni TaxID=112498 RepID=A0A2D3V139_9PEZI|nr:uncharacterized protein RCC_02026 [Ramularia collo-cygni]CZT16184.1 uncharacterized protein RCC_02026 [Ramularia collo-cygni]